MFRTDCVPCFNIEGQFTDKYIAVECYSNWKEINWPPNTIFLRLVYEENGRTYMEVHRDEATDEDYCYHTGMSRWFFVSTLPKEWITHSRFDDLKFRRPVTPEMIWNAPKSSSCPQWLKDRMEAIKKMPPPTLKQVEEQFAASARQQKESEVMPMPYEKHTTNADLTSPETTSAGVGAKYCDDPDNCGYSDCPTAFCDKDKPSPLETNPVFPSKKEFLAMPIEKRRQILETQSELMKDYYNKSEMVELWESVETSIDSAGVGASVKCKFTVCYKNLTKEVELPNAKWDNDVNDYLLGAEEQLLIDKAKVKLVAEYIKDKLILTPEQAVEMLKCYHSLAGLARYTYPQFSTKDWLTTYRKEKGL